MSQLSLDRQRLKMGPVLLFRELGAQSVKFATIVVTSDGAVPPPLSAEGCAYEPCPLQFGSSPYTVWQYCFSIKRQAGRWQSSYSIGEQTWTIHLPEQNRLRTAFISCNGDAQDTLGHETFERNNLWRHLADTHAQRPFHLLIQGGDQLYADAIWREIPALVAWARLDDDEQLREPWTPELEAAVTAFYFERYCHLWSQRDVAPVVASIPSLMMWDDHDIFDGWGSHGAALQQSPIFQGIWAIARKAFAAFQLGALTDQLPSMFGDPRGGHFGYAVQLGEVGIIAPDLRSERTQECVIGDAGWKWLEETLHRMTPCRQLFLIFSVPVAHLNWSGIERILRFTGWVERYHDDIRDQWQSLGHRVEWEALLACLLDVVSQSQARVTLLSGEVHLGSWGVIERGPMQIDQLVSSGIVHDPPSPWAARFFELWGRRPTTLSDGTQVRLQLLPEWGRRFLAVRNWLSLDYGPDGQLNVAWHPEGRRDMRLSLPSEEM